MEEEDDDDKAPRHILVRLLPLLLLLLLLLLLEDLRQNERLGACTPTRGEREVRVAWLCTS